MCGACATRSTSCVSDDGPRGREPTCVRDGCGSTDPAAECAVRRAADEDVRRTTDSARSTSRRIVRPDRRRGRHRSSCSEAAECRGASRSSTGSVRRRSRRRGVTPEDIDRTAMVGGASGDHGPGLRRRAGRCVLRADDRLRRPSASACQRHPRRSSVDVLPEVTACFDENLSDDLLQQFCMTGPHPGRRRLRGDPERRRGVQQLLSRRAWRSARNRCEPIRSDAAYLALAEAIEAPLVTCDGPLGAPTVTGPRSSTIRSDECLVPYGGRHRRHLRDWRREVRDLRPRRLRRRAPRRARGAHAARGRPPCPPWPAWRRAARWAGPRSSRRAWRRAATSATCRSSATTPPATTRAGRPSRPPPSGCGCGPTRSPTAATSSRSGPTARWSTSPAGTRPPRTPPRSSRRSTPSWGAGPAARSSSTPASSTATSSSPPRAGPTPRAPRPTT